jgi:hypothetical protein
MSIIHNMALPTMPSINGQLPQLKNTITTMGNLVGSIETIVLLFLGAALIFSGIFWAIEGKRGNAGAMHSGSRMFIGILIALIIVGGTTAIVTMMTGIGAQL